MSKKLSRTDARVSYLNDFTLPNGKNLMPFKLKQVPLWLIKHAIHEVKIRFSSKFGKSDSRFVRSIQGWKLSSISVRNMIDVANYEKFLATRPHPRAGFGHQMSTVLAGLEIAEDFNLKYAISGLPKDWSIEMGLCNLLNGVDAEINREIKLGNIRNRLGDGYAKPVSDMLSKNYSKAVLFWGPFDDSKVDLTRGGKLLRQYYLKDTSKVKTGSGKIVVHVRRARVGELGSQAPYRNLPSEYYLEAISEVIKSNISKSTISEVVLLGTEIDELQQMSKRLADRLTSKVTATTGCCDVGAFRLLATSEIMIGSKSGFSYTAGLVNPGKIFFPKNFWHKIPESWTTL
jgi:hypothetical protein